MYHRFGALERGLQKRTGREAKRKQKGSKREAKGKQREGIVKEIWER